MSGPASRIPTKKADVGLTASRPFHSTTARTAVLCEQQVTVAPRRAGNRPWPARKKHPARPGRVATLQYAAQRLMLQRPHAPPYAHLPVPLAVHVVAVREIATPAGEEPLEWRLITTDAVDTVDQVLRIVDWDRTRWVIAEFF